MEIQKIQSFPELQGHLKSSSRIFLLLYKQGAIQSDCALRNLGTAVATIDKAVVMKANVSDVKDIHTVYGITTVPSLLEFAGGEFRNVVKGCHSPEYYAAYFNNALFSAPAAESATPQKQVRVYTTPSCTWCTTLKTHLRKHGIRYTEIDVASDPSAAEEMTRRSGQRGVPQTDIEGEMIVGFDKARINRLLGING
jgi:glutaredoxin-like YruB-family protein